MNRCPGLTIDQIGTAEHYNISPTQTSNWLAEKSAGKDASVPKRFEGI